MVFAVTEEQRLLADNLRRLLSENNDLASRRNPQVTTTNRRKLWSQLGEIGVISAAFDEAHGGLAGDPRFIAVVQYELATALALEPFLAAAAVSGRILQQSSSPEASRLIPELIAGTKICVLAHDAGSDPFGMPSVTATMDQGCAILSGEACCVQYGDIADIFLVTARMDGATAIFIVPRDVANLSVNTYRCIDGSTAADLGMIELRLPADSLLTFETAAETVLNDAIEWGLLGLCAETAGIVKALNQTTFRYLNERKQFGAALATFQALQHRAADMHIAAEEIIAIADTAIEALARPASMERSAIIALAKVVADSCGRRVGHEAIQLHGGMGVSDELNVSHYARRLAAIRAELGSADVHRLRFGALQ